MSRNLAAIPTIYAGVTFRSRLEARYAAFFDLINWKWEYEPLDLNGWIPDFRVDPAYWGDYGDHFMLVEVKPYYSIDEFRGTVEYDLAMDQTETSIGFVSENTVALFGNNPAVSFWELWGSGITSLPEQIKDWKQKWNKAGDIVRWRPN